MLEPTTVPFDSIQPLDKVEFFFIVTLGPTIDFVIVTPSSIVTSTNSTVRLYDISSENSYFPKCGSQLSLNSMR